MDTREVTAAAEEELTEPEQQLVAAAGNGGLVDLRAGVAELNDPANGASWEAARTVRAEVLAALLVGDRAPPGGKRVRAVRLRGARITGRLDLEAATLECPLLLWDCHLERSIILNEARAPAVRLPGCRVPALVAQQLETLGNLELNEGFTATGMVGLLGAHIGGTLDLSGATLTNPGRRALIADRLTVDLAMFCREGFTATGEVRLLGAHIGGVLDFREATLTNPGGNALTTDGLTVDLAMFCGKGFTATGEVSLVGAQIGRQIDFEGAILVNPDRVALSLEGVRAPALFLLPQKPPEGIVDLTNARVGSFFDDDQTTSQTRLRLHGFAYDVLENDRVSVRARLDWLRRHQGGYTPQPYEQLAGAYRRDGRDEAARRVLIAKQWRRRGRFNPWNWLLYASVGYGYRSWLAVLWLLILLWVGTGALDQAQQAGLLAPAKDNPSQQPTFHPLTYALDLLLPIVNLGQEGAWIPRGWAERWTWGLVLAGWVLTIAVVAGLTGVLKRD